LSAPKSERFCPEDWTADAQLNHRLVRLASRSQMTWFQDRKSNRSSGQPSEFCEQTLEALSYGVRGRAIERRQLLTGISVQLKLNEEIQLRVREHALRNASVEEVPQQCKSLEVVFEFDENTCLGVGMIERSSFPAFSLRPFEDVPLHFSRDGVCKMRAPRCHLRRSQKLEKEKEYLLRDVLFGQALLLPGYQADGTMQHRKKYENQKTLGEGRIRFAKRKDFAEEVVVGGVGR
jgi:hypothetical protein